MHILFFTYYVLSHKENNMLKKYLGGFSLLIFVFAFAAPLCVLTPPAASSDNYTFTQPYTAYYYCDDGTLLYTTTGTSTNTETVDHPEETCEIVGNVYWHYYQEGRLIDTIKEPRIECEHTDHGMTYVYNSNRVSYTRSASERACR